MNTLKKYTNKFKNVCFQSSSGETPEFRAFSNGLKTAMKKEIREEYPDLELTTYSKGHFYVSGFITRKSDGAIFYFSFGDVRRFGSVVKEQMYRSARSLKDYTDGHNCWTESGNLIAAIAKARYEYE